MIGSYAVVYCEGNATTITTENDLKLVTRLLHQAEDEEEHSLVSLTSEGTTDCTVTCNPAYEPIPENLYFYV